MRSALKQSRKCRLSSGKNSPTITCVSQNKEISVVWYEKNGLIKIGKFISNFKCPTYPDFTDDNTAKVIKEGYKTAGYHVNPFKLTSFTLELPKIPNFTI